MSTSTIEQMRPLLVSELPPAAPSATVWTRLSALVVARVAERRFERALRHAGPGEHGDLLALARRS